MFSGVAVGTTALFFGSFLLIFREGFEALLVIGALAAYLRKSKRDDRVRDLYLGAGAAVAASLALWVLAKTVIQISGAQVEMIEGFTLLVATVVIGRSDVRRGLKRIVPAAGRATRLQHATGVY